MEGRCYKPSKQPLKNPWEMLNSTKHIFYWSYPWKRLGAFNPLLWTKRVNTNWRSYSRPWLMGQYFWVPKTLGPLPLKERTFVCPGSQGSGGRHHERQSTWPKHRMWDVDNEFLRNLAACKTPLYKDKNVVETNHSKISKHNFNSQVLEAT